MIGASVEGVVAMTLHPVMHHGAAEIGSLKIKGYVQAYGIFYDEVQKHFDNRWHRVNLRLFDAIRVFNTSPAHAGAEGRPTFSFSYKALY